MSENEQTNKTNTDGTADSKLLAADGAPLSDYEKALELVKRREEATKAEKEVLDEKKKLAANEMIGGTAGGRVEPEKVDPEKQKNEDAAEYFKGTQLEKDIKKANE